MGAIEDLAAQATTPRQAMGQGGAVQKLLMLQQLTSKSGQGGDNGRGRTAGRGPDGNGIPKSGDADQLIRFAQRQVGKPYVWGSTGMRGFDCSGLIYRGLTKLWGHPPPARTAASMQQWTKSVSRKGLDPGDLVFMHYPNSRGIGPGQASHVGLYAGHGKMVNAGSGGVQYEPVDWSAFIGGGVIPHL